MRSYGAARATRKRVHGRNLQVSPCRESLCWYVKIRSSCTYKGTSRYRRALTLYSTSTRIAFSSCGISTGLRRSVDASHRRTVPAMRAWNEPRDRVSCIFVFVLGTLVGQTRPISRTVSHRRWRRLRWLAYGRYIRPDMGGSLKMRAPSPGREDSHDLSRRPASKDNSYHSSSPISKAPEVSACSMSGSSSLTHLHSKQRSG